MQRKQKKVIKNTLIGLTFIGTSVIALNISTVDVQAIGWGDGNKTHDVLDELTQKKVIGIKFNTNYSSKQADFYGGDQIFYKDVYFPESKKLPGGFVWYSIVPPDALDRPLKEYDMSKMLENRQKVLGSGGEYLVTEAKREGYGLNLKYGAIDPWTRQYLGKNTASKTIKYGDYKDYKYEWRYSGYTQGGAAIASPYFPDDEVSETRRKLKTRAQVDNYWQAKSWIPYSWNTSYSKEAFGISEYNSSSKKVQWIRDYFLPQHPEFRKQGDENYWKNYLMPMSNPETETGIWLGWHGSNPWYVTFITEPAKQPNLRLVDYKIYDSENNLVARQTRNKTDYYNVDEKITISDNQGIHKGETYRIEADVKNMTDIEQNIKNFPIELEHMYSYDNKIGLATDYSTPEYRATADAPNKKRLDSGDTAHFSYTFTVPTSAKPKDEIQFNARIPYDYFESGFNMNQYDDDASIILEIAPENLGVEFEGYYDINKNPVDYVTPNYDMWVKYKVTKTDGTMPVDGADLKIQLTDTKTVTKNKTYDLEGVYDKKGKPITDGKLKKKGDYAIFWASITPRNPKVCTEASIPSKWADAGLNGNSADDVVKPACIANPDNIVVSNVVAKPQTVYLSESQSKKSVQYTVSYNLTNFNYDKKDKVIPVVYTIDGVKKYTEEINVESLKTMKISRILPAVNVGVGEHIIQVEANPTPRKYVEVKTNSLGEEVSPYSDNIGWDRVNVEKNKDDFRCAVRHTTNYWNTTFSISTWYGSWVTYPCEEHGSHTYCEKDWYYSNPTVSFNEKQEIKNIFFKSKFTTDKKGGWVDLLNTKGTIKAGYGFELKVVTTYQTNTYNDTPTAFDYGCSYGRNVSPGYSWVDSSARLKVTMPFTDDSGKPIALTLDGKQTGSWYNTTTTYELEPRTVINKSEKKMYINENTKDGNYNVRVETEPFYGSYDKPSTSSQLCDIQNVTIEVKGSYLDDVKTHVVQ